MSTQIADLDVSVQPKAQCAWIQMQKSQELKKLGVTGIAIVETKRELTTQMAYYSRGRMDPADVQKMYAAAGLYKISTEEAKQPNTWTLLSKHLTGRAIDFCPVKDGKQWWNAPLEVWQEMGRIGELCGLEWGGRWQKHDYPHFQG